VEIPNKQLVTAALVVMFGSNATGFLNAYNPNFRADGVTLTYVNNEIRKINQRFDATRIRCEGIHRELEGRHQVEMHDMEADIDDYADAELRRHTENEINIRNLQYRMNRCEERLQ